MKVTEINWQTLTEKQAAGLRAAAFQNTKKIEKLFEADQATQEQLWAACEIEEDLRIFVITGTNPRKVAA